MTEKKIEEIKEEKVKFESFNLNEDLMKALEDKNIVYPTPIQNKVIPPAIDGRDIIGCSETGSGKTVAFMLPVLERLTGKRGLRCVVIEPTRELALQVQDVVRELIKYTDLKCVAVFGGGPVARQGHEIRNGADIIVATPGRLIDLTWQGIIDFAEVNHFIVDEVDRMFDMGFVDDVKQIISFLPRTEVMKQAFTATLNKNVKNLLGEFMEDPLTIVIGRESRTAAGIEHRLYPLREVDKTKALLHILKNDRPVSTIIFTSTKHSADRLYNKLRDRGFEVSSLHSGHSQITRYDVLRAFRDKKIKILVATDVASRGLDITDITHIINYDVPSDPEDYVHRTGRTARADAIGIAITLGCKKEARYLIRIEKLTKMTLPRIQIPGITIEDIETTWKKPTKFKTKKKFFKKRTPKKN